MELEIITRANTEWEPVGSGIHELRLRATKERLACLTERYEYMISITGETGKAPQRPFSMAQQHVRKLVNQRYREAKEKEKNNMKLDMENTIWLQVNDLTWKLRLRDTHETLALLDIRWYDYKITLTGEQGMVANAINLGDAKLYVRQLVERRYAEREEQGAVEQDNEEAEDKELRWTQDGNTHTCKNFLGAQLAKLTEVAGTTDNDGNKLYAAKLTFNTNIRAKTAEVAKSTVEELGLKLEEAARLKLDAAGRKKAELPAFPQLKEYGWLPCTDENMAIMDSRLQYGDYIVVMFADGSTSVLTSIGAIKGMKSDPMIQFYSIPAHKPVSELVREAIDDILNTAEDNELWGIFKDSLKNFYGSEMHE